MGSVTSACGRVLSPVVLGNPNIGTETVDGSANETVSF